MLVIYLLILFLIGNPTTTYVPGTLSHLNGEIFQDVGMQMVDLKKYNTDT